MNLTRRAFLASLMGLSGALMLPSWPSPLLTWPGPETWEELRLEVGERLLAVESPLKPCLTAPGSAACAETLRSLRNPFALEDDPGCTQSTGWLGAWTSSVSPYAVAIESPADVAAAVRFARRHRIPRRSLSRFLRMRREGQQFPDSRAVGVEPLPGDRELSAPAGTR